MSNLVHSIRRHAMNFSRCTLLICLVLAGTPLVVAQSSHPAPVPAATDQAQDDRRPAERTDAGASPEELRASPERALMRNGITTVTVDDFQTELLKIPEDQRNGFLLDRQRVTRLTEALLINKSLAELGRREKVDQDPTVQKRLRLQHEKAVAEVYVDEFIARKSREFDAKLPAFEQRAKEIYAVNREKYRVPEIVTAYHILIRTDRRTPDEAKAKLDELIRRIVGGEEFQAVAREASEDGGTAESGGQLTFTREAVEKSFGEAAFALKNPGDLSAPVRTVHGYHVIQLKEHSPARVRGFDEARAQLLAELRKQFISDERDALQRSFFAEPAFQIDEAALAGLQKRFDPKTQRWR